MTTVRLSLSIPEDAHSDLKVSVEQPDGTDVVLNVPLSSSVDHVEASPVQSIRPLNRARSTEQEKYELGGYAGI